VSSVGFATPSYQNGPLPFILVRSTAYIYSETCSSRWSRTQSNFVIGVVLRGGINPALGLRREGRLSNGALDDFDGMSARPSTPRRAAGLARSATMRRGRPMCAPQGDVSWHSPLK
jgi:hypothetical protein